MWKLYESLIDTVDEEVQLEELIVGLSWVASRSKTTGLAMSSPRPISPLLIAGTLQGQPLQKVAQLIKSWNPLEAAMGLSAVNSYNNTADRLAEMERDGYVTLPSGSAFDLMAPKLEGKKVAVIGRFRHVDDLAEFCDLTVLERNPEENDLPDPAAEFILPQQDVVFMTSSILINKTAPRLLELTKNATTIMMGPGTPISPVLFEMGVDIISGLIVEEEGHVLRAVKEGGGMQTFKKAVKYVNLAKEEL